MANKRLDFIKNAVASANAPADRNEGQGRPYANTEGRQGYTSKSLPGLRGGKVPGNSGRRGTGPQRAGKGDSGMPANGVPVMPNNGLEQQLSDKPGKVPYASEEQRADLQDRLLGMYAKRQQSSKRDADRKRLGKKLNGSAGPAISNRRITRTQNT